MNSRTRKASTPVSAMTIRKAASYVADTTVRNDAPISLRTRRRFSGTRQSPFSLNGRRRSVSIEYVVGWYGHLIDALEGAGHTVSIGIDGMGINVTVYTEAYSDYGVIFWAPPFDANGDDKWVVVYGNLAYGDIDQAVLGGRTQPATLAKRLPALLKKAKTFAPTPSN